MNISQEDAILICQLDMVQEGCWVNFPTMVKKLVSTVDAERDLLATAASLV